MFETGVGKAILPGIFLLQELACDTNQEAVSVRRLERVLGELGH